MKVVNLAKRPFRNRRPVARLALALWILGGLLLALNLWWWGGHFRGSSNSNDRLELLERQVSQEEKKLEEYGQDLRQVRLGARNQKARYLNLLIHRRTFPWSRLFGEIEEVLPDNVYLVDVTPNIEFANDRSTRSRGRSTRGRVSLREARSRARRAARGEDVTATPATEAQGEDAQENELKEPPRDRVTLSIGGYARTEEAYFHFVDLLYAHPSFLDPTVFREEGKDRDAVSFRVRTVYLTPAREALPVFIEDLPPAEGEGKDSGQQLASRDSGTDGGPAPAEGVSTSDAAVPRIDAETASAIAGAGGVEGIAAGGQTLPRTGAEGGAGAEDAEAPALERRGRGFVEDTLRDRRSRAAQRRAAARERAAAANSDDNGTRTTGRRTSRGDGSSRVSVAPRQRTSGSGVTQPQGQNLTPQGEADPRGEATPRRPLGPDPRNPSAGSGGNSDEIDRPTPVQPDASASPRFGGLLQFLPDFLRPELSIPAGPTDQEAA